MFRVGDRVMYTGGFGKLPFGVIPFGAKGIVYSIGKDSYCNVIWDGFRRGHSGGANDGSMNHWVVAPDTIVLDKAFKLKRLLYG